MYAVAMLDRQDQTGSAPVNLVLSARTRRMQGRLRAQGARSENSPTSQALFRMCALAMLEQLDPTGQERVNRVEWEHTRLNLDLMHVLYAKLENFLSKWVQLPMYVLVMLEQLAPTG